MPTDKELAAIRAIQAKQDELIAQMDSKLKVVFEELSNQVVDITDSLSLDPKDRAKNLREMMRMKSELATTIVENSAYQEQVAALLAGFRELQGLSDTYLGLILDSPIRRKELYNAILETNISITKDALLGGGIRDNFGNAIQEVLKTNISGVTSRKELRKVLQQFIEGTAQERPFLERYIKQTTNDAVMTFNREYIQTVSGDLNLKHYRYQGTIIEDSRPFCKARSGKVYTKQQVEKWADLGKWDGRMSGTTKTTIFSYCGGYNCRHTLFPISEKRYKEAKEAEKS